MFRKMFGFPKRAEKTSYVKITHMEENIKIFVNHSFEQICPMSLLTCFSKTVNRSCYRNLFVLGMLRII